MDKAKERIFFQGGTAIRVVDNKAFKKERDRTKKEQSKLVEGVHPDGLVLA